MKPRQSSLWILLTALTCCAIMAWVDGWLRPGYAIKSAIKLSCFGAVPLLLYAGHKETGVFAMFRPEKKGVLSALGLGIGVYGVIMGAYFLLRNHMDFAAIAGSLTENAGVNKDNFLLVSLYISFVNSMLEEFFFRGFLFSGLKQRRGRGFAYLFSSILFALYHVAMMTGWFSPWLMLLALTGLAAGGAVFNYLNERFGCIYISWMVHMFANFAINTIGFIILNR